LRKYEIECEQWKEGSKKKLAIEAVDAPLERAAYWWLFSICPSNLLTFINRCKSCKLEEEGRHVDLKEGSRKRLAGWVA